MSRRSAVMTLIAVVAALVVVPVPPGTAGGGCYEDRYRVEKAGPGGGRVAMLRNCFKQTVLMIDEGDTVRFVNRDPTDHTVGGVGGSFGKLFKSIRPGESVSYTFDAEGVFPYTCTIHPGMAGAVVVGDGVSMQSAAGFVPVARPPVTGTDPTSKVPDEGSAVPVVALVAGGVFALGLAAAIVGRARTRRSLQAPAA